MNKSILSILLFLSVAFFVNSQLTANVTSNCTANPFLRSASNPNGIQGLATPQNGSSLKYCPFLLDDQQCCSDETINNFTLEIQKLRQTIMERIKLRDQNISNIVQQNIISFQVMQNLSTMNIRYNQFSQQLLKLNLNVTYAQNASDSSNSSVINVTDPTNNNQSSSSNNSQNNNNSQNSSNNQSNNSSQNSSNNSSNNQSANNTSNQSANNTGNQSANNTANQSANNSANQSSNSSTQNETQTNQSNASQNNNGSKRILRSSGGRGGSSSRSSSSRSSSSSSRSSSSSSRSGSSSSSSRSISRSSVSTRSSSFSRSRSFSFSRTGSSSSSVSSSRSFGAASKQSSIFSRSSYKTSAYAQNTYAQSLKKGGKSYSYSRSGIGYFQRPSNWQFTYRSSYYHSRYYYFPMVYYGHSYSYYGYRYNSYNYRRYRNKYQNQTNQTIDPSTLAFEQQQQLMIDSVKQQLRDFKDDFSSFQQNRAMCIVHFLQLKSKFQCMACMPDSSTFFKDGKLVLNQTVCHRLANQCHDFLYDNEFMQDYTNLDEIKYNINIMNQTYYILKQYEEYTKQLVQQVQKANTTVNRQKVIDHYNMLSQKVQGLDKYNPLNNTNIDNSQKRQKINCTNSSNCEGLCQQIFNKFEGLSQEFQIDQPSIQVSNSTLDDYNDNSNQTQSRLRLLQQTASSNSTNDSQVVFDESDGFEVDQLESGQEGEIDFDYDPANVSDLIANSIDQSTNGIKLFSNISMIAFIILLAFLN